MSHSAGLAGAERSLLELVETLAKTRMRCLVVVPYKGPLFGELKKRGIDVVRIPFTWWMGSSSPITSHRIRRLFSGASIACRAVRTLLNLATFPIIAAEIRFRRCDVVYTNTMTVCAGAFAAWLVHRPHVWHIREFGFEDFQLVFDLGERFSLKLMDRLSSIVVVNSRAVAAKFIPYFGSAKVRLIYGPIAVNIRNAECKSTLPAPDGTAIRCVIVGSLHKAKGQEDAVLATAELRRLGLLPVLWIVGGTLDHEYERHLRRLVRDLELEASVKFLGWMDNPFPAMQQADVVLVCSRHEARGRVTIEGMLAGKPVIGTRIGGTLELIQDGFNGLLYTPGDYAALAQKIRYLYEHPGEALRMGQSGREWARARFSQSQFTEEVLSTLTRALAEWSQRDLDHDHS